MRYAPYHIDPMKAGARCPGRYKKTIMTYRSDCGIVSHDYPLDDLVENTDDDHPTLTEREALDSFLAN